MKILIFVFSMVISWQVWAANLTVDITSFSYTDSVGRLAEICGQVKGDNFEKSAVTITVDPNSKAPGKYTVLVDNSGKFCSVVVSYTGHASAVAFIK